MSAVSGAQKTTFTAFHIGHQALFVTGRYCITSQVSFQPWVVSLRRLAGVGRGPQWLSTAVEAWLIDRA